jgi:uncharacterized coiled-coil protein SlyX
VKTVTGKQILLETRRRNEMAEQTKETGAITDLELAIELANSYEMIPRMQANIRMLIQEINKRQQQKTATVEKEITDGKG